MFYGPHATPRLVPLVCVISVTVLLTLIACEEPSVGPDSWTASRPLFTEADTPTTQLCNWVGCYEPNPGQQAEIEAAWNSSLYWYSQQGKVEFIFSPIVAFQQLTVNFA